MEDSSAIVAAVVVAPAIAAVVIAVTFVIAAVIISVHRAFLWSGGGHNLVVKGFKFSCQRNNINRRFNGVDCCGQPEGDGSFNKKCFLNQLGRRTDRRDNNVNS